MPSPFCLSEHNTAPPTLVAAFLSEWVYMGEGSDTFPLLRFCAYSVPSTYSSHPCCCVSFGTEDGKHRIVYTKESERWMRGVRSFVRRKRSGGWEVTNRLYEGNGAKDGGGTKRMYSAVGEKSIDFLKKLYRPSGKTL